MGPALDRRHAAPRWRSRRRRPHRIHHAPVQPHAAASSRPFSSRFARRYGTLTEEVLGDARGPGRSRRVARRRAHRARGRLSQRAGVGARAGGRAVAADEVRAAHDERGASCRRGKDRRADVRASPGLPPVAAWAAARACPDRTSGSAQGPRMSMTSRVFAGWHRCAVASAGGRSPIASSRSRLRVGRSMAPSAFIARSPDSASALSVRIVAVRHARSAHRACRWRSRRCSPLARRWRPAACLRRRRAC